MIQRTGKREPRRASGGRYHPFLVLAKVLRGLSLAAWHEPRTIWSPAITANWPPSKEVRGRRKLYICIHLGCWDHFGVSMTLVAKPFPVVLVIVHALFRAGPLTCISPALDSLGRFLHPHVVEQALDQLSRGLPSRGWAFFGSFGRNCGCCCVRTCVPAFVSCAPSMPRSGSVVSASAAVRSASCVPGSTSATVASPTGAVFASSMSNAENGSLSSSSKTVLGATVGPSTASGASSASTWSTGLCLSGCVGGCSVVLVVV